MKCPNCKRIYEENCKFCPYCGEEILAGARKCKHCGEWLDDVITNAPSNSQPAIGTRPVTVMTRPSEQSVNQPIVINNTVQRSNGIGTAGFIFALISAIFSWVPGVGWFIWFLGALFSFIGLAVRYTPSRSLSRERNVLPLYSASGTYFPR